MTELLVSGMTCGNCARHVTEALQSVPGVRSAAVDLGAGRASVQWSNEAAPDEDKLIAAIQSAGYEGSRVETQAGGQTRNWHLNLWVGGIVTAALMLGEWGLGLAMERWFQWLAFALAGVVQVFCGAQFYRGAWRQLKVGDSNMDTLVALGSSTAFGYSVWALLSGQGGHVYFMEAAAIITLISIGHWIEARVGEKASSALQALMELAPATARKLENPKSAGFDIRKSSFSNTPKEMDVPVSELRSEDLIVLRPGERVPVDGMVTEGDSVVDESMLTGESAPVDKSAGKEVYAGTMNVNGRLVMQVTATGEATALANIITAVRRAQTSRADIQRLGDRISGVFVPIVVVVALAAGLWWGLAPASALRVHDWLGTYLWHTHVPGGAAAAFVIAAAVLIIACPCAMGLATPAAIMASANAAARRGILIRDGVALEKAGNVTAVVFDKTGTLTVGKPEMAAGWSASFSSAGNTLRKELQLAAAMARHSTHPISQAIAKISTETVLVTDWREVRGGGVEGNVQPIGSGENTRQPPVKGLLGSLRWLKESGVELGAGETFIAECSGQGATIVGLALDQKLVAMLALKDTLKPGAAGVVEQLQRRGLKTFLLTGDNASTAANIAKQAGIAAENVGAEVKPEQKAEFIQQLQARGERVAFVGDGINDAPALTQADLGIAVGRASDVAREAADVILLKSEIEAVPEALGLARATLRTIKQNLFWAFFYNAVGVPLAALGFMSPVLCAAAMGLSDLVVIGNALRLTRWRAK